jgi:site-specific DNA recombinase
MTDASVALYARVSSESQARDNTIASQIAALRERIAADGWQLEPDHTYVDDGYSGAILLRPALEQLRDAVAAGCVERIYVHAQIGSPAATPIKRSSSRNSVAPAQWLCS